jgi:hypothetical protein
LSRRIWIGQRALTILAILVVTGGAWLLARKSSGAQLVPTVTLTAETNQRGHEFPAGAVGLSIEPTQLATGRLTARYHRLVGLMRLFGPAVLRIGGGSVEFTWWTANGEPKPAWAIDTITPTDLYALRGLLRATGWRALLGVDLAHFEPTRAVQEASYASRILGKSLLGIEIGNEPDGYPLHHLRSQRYSAGEYLREAEVYQRSLTASVPGLAVYGPATTSTTQWPNQMGTQARMFTAITQHYYPINTCPAKPPPLGPEPTAATLLSPATREQENTFLARLTKAGALAGRPTRIDETNSVACNAHSDASPGFAGALWALDWALRAASSGVSGLNFYAWLPACDANPESPICVPGRGAAGIEDLEANVDDYGLLAARELEGGVFVPTRITGAAPMSELTAWATRARDGTVKIAIEDFSTAGPPQRVSLSTSGYRATEETLTAPAFDANNGATLGGGAVSANGVLHAKPLRLRGRRFVHVMMNPATAVIITLRLLRSGH